MCVFFNNGLLNRRSKDSILQSLSRFLIYSEIPLVAEKLIVEAISLHTLAILQTIHTKFLGFFLDQL